jgi:hypothetical protein
MRSGQCLIGGVKIVLTFISLLLFWTFTAIASPELKRVHVGGDVPQPGPLEIVEKELPTFDVAIREMGVDLAPFYSEKTGVPGRPACPLRVELYRNGQAIRIFDPSIDQRELKTERVQLNDTLVVRDFRKQPGKIEEQRKRIEKALELGSVQLAHKIQAMADLRFEYNRWLLDDHRPEVEGKSAALREEVARLCKEGKGPNIIQLLEFDRGVLVSSGIGRADPVLQRTEDLKRMFEEQSGEKLK